MSKLQRNDARKLRALDFDLANYFSNTLIPQLFVDSDLILRIFTPPAMEQFSLSYSDVGRSIHDVKDNIRYPTIVRNIQEVISGGKILEKEVQTTDENWFQMNIVPYVEHEKNLVNGVIITFINITKRLVTIKELEKLNSEHQTLMFALAHDIRQPISTMSLLVDGLVKAHKNNDSEQFHKWIETLRTSSRSIKSLVDDFTPKEESDQGRKSEKERLNIENIYEDVLLSLRDEIRSNNVTISSNFKAQEIVFPKNHLRSILYNLIHNAIKFSDSRKSPNIKIATEGVDDYVVLCIKDNGMGIAREHQKLIFEKSSRMHKDIKGTGMGLFIIKRMIENNNGRIELKSSPGEGSLFKVYFKNPFSIKKSS